MDNRASSFTVIKGVLGMQYKRVIENDCSKINVWYPIFFQPLLFLTFVNEIKACPVLGLFHQQLTR